MSMNPRETTEKNQARLSELRSIYSGSERQ